MYLGGKEVFIESSKSLMAVLSRSVMFDSLQPHGLQPTRLLCLWGFSRQEYRSGLPYPPPGDLPNSRIKLRSPALQMDSLPSEPLGKPKNTGVGSLSLLQGIFPTQETNQGFLHCGQILYQLATREAPLMATCSLSQKALLFCCSKLVNSP